MARRRKTPPTLAKRFNTVFGDCHEADDAGMILKWLKENDPNASRQREGENTVFHFTDGSVANLQTMIADLPCDDGVMRKHPWPDMPVSNINTIGELRDYIEEALRRGVSRDHRMERCDNKGNLIGIKCTFIDDEGPGCPAIMVIDHAT